MTKYLKMKKLSKIFMPSVLCLLVTANNAFASDLQGAIEIADLGSDNYIVDIQLDNDGNIYLLDKEISEITKLNSTGQEMDKFGSIGSADGEFRNPAGFDIDNDGNIYIADTGNKRVQKLDSDGNHIETVNKIYSVLQGAPIDISVDNDGNVYTLIHETLMSPEFKIIKTNSKGIMSGLGPTGKKLGEVSKPNSIAVDNDGHIYTAEENRPGGQKIDTSEIDGEIYHIGLTRNVTVDNKGNVYYLKNSETNHSIIKISPDGEKQEVKFNSSIRIVDIAAKDEDQIYMIDYISNKLLFTDFNETYEDTKNIFVNDTSEKISYTGNWTVQAYRKSQYTNNGTAELTFSGNYIKVLMGTQFNTGNVEISIDGKQVAVVNTNSGERIPKVNVFEATLDIYGHHTIKIKSLNGDWIVFDGFEYGTRN